MMFLAVVFVGTLFAGYANTEQVENFRMCRNTRCDVRDLYIDPCPEALEGKACEIPHGVNASIDFKFTSHFSSKKFRSRLYAVTILMDLPFLDMDTNACLYTDCPLVADREQNYRYNLFVAPKYPTGAYTVKMRLWNADSGSSYHDECCFKFDMKIV